MTDDYRLYLEEKFKGLHIQMDTEFKLLNDSINRVEAQTIKTNGRVTELEKSHSVINCPNTKKLDDISDDLMEYNFIRKYPKVAILVISIVVVMFLASCFNAYSIYTEKKELTKIENSK
jgi:hypothetical protein